MARRTDILDALVTHLAANTTAHVNNVHKSYKYLDDINDYPTITFLPQTETRVSRGADFRQGLLNIFIRGYVYSEEDALGTAETFGMAMDDALDTFAENNRTLQVEEARVTEFRTDEGLFHPYGMADLSLQILYEVDDAIK